MITQELWDRTIHGTPDERRFLTKNCFELFALYYFSDFFEYKSPQFHQLFYSDIQRLIDGELNEAAWIAFAESAKTTIAKMAVQWIICGKKRRYINWDSYDLENPENALFDIIVSLQTNLKIKADFGDLYIEKRSNQEKILKRVSAFITTNKIKVEAFSTGTSPRGRIYLKYRPDFYIFDDIENVITRRSVKITRKIIEHYDEVKRGMSTNSSILVLGNYITETGVIQNIMNRMEKNPRGVVRNIPVIDLKTKDIAWKSKYVMTDKEAFKKNKEIKDSRKLVVSLESKRRDLGEQNYKENMLNDPAGAAEPFFDRRKVDSAIEKCSDPIDVLAGFHIFSRYNPSHRYAIGGDSSMGIGLDSNASTLIDFSTIPNKTAGTYINNEIAPDVFAYELKREGDMYGTCLIAPEVNGESGGACLNTLKRIYKNIFQTQNTKQLYNKATYNIGWRTTSASKPEMLYRFKSDFEDGILDILDRRLLLEMRSFTILDMAEHVSPLDTTKHFDLLMSACIANMMREHARPAKVEKPKIIRDVYETPSITQPEVRTGTVGYVQRPHRRSIPHREYESGSAY